MFPEEFLQEFGQESRQLKEQFPEALVARGADDHFVVITSLERVYYADIGGLDSVGVTTALIKCVKEF